MQRSPKRQQPLAPEDLRARLTKYCAQREALEEELVAAGFVDEERFAHSFVREKFRFNGWGRVKLRYELQGHGLAAGLIEQALEAELEPAAYAALADRLLADKRQQLADAGLAEQRQKAGRYLQQRGFTMEEIQAALARAGLAD
jgi:regulatory protein